MQQSDDAPRRDGSDTERNELCAPVADALARLRADEVVVLPGSESAGVRRYRLNLRRNTHVAISVAITGVLFVCCGLVASALEAGAEFFAMLDPLGLGARVIPVCVAIGALLIVMGGLVFLALRINEPTARAIRAAEVEPVVLDRTGFRARGVGPVQWCEVDPPRTKRLRVPFDIGGLVDVMPLTEPGVRRMNEWPALMGTEVGPPRTIAFSHRYVLLPGIQGFTNGDVKRLFGAARALALQETPHTNDDRPATGTETT